MSTTHLSDWSHLLGYALKPFQARVPVGDSLGLALVFCSEVDDDELSALVSTCAPETGDVRATNWAVNGAPGGSSPTGTVAAAGGYPGRVPRPRSEAVAGRTGRPFSAVLGRGTDVYQVASSVTIVDRSSSVGATDASSSFVDLTAHTPILWTLESTTNNVSLYRPSGAAIREDYGGCIVTPDHGDVDPLGLLMIDFNADPPNLFRRRRGVLGPRTSSASTRFPSTVTRRFGPSMRRAV